MIRLSYAPEILKADVVEALDFAAPPTGEIVLNSVLLTAASL